MNLKLIKKLCGLTRGQLQLMLIKYLKSKGYQDIVSTNMYLIAEGELPVCLLAHMDTVFPVPPRTFYYDSVQTTLWSPDGLGADDRAGIYTIISLIERGYKPSLIFTDLEENGGIGADSLVKRFPECPFAECKALIQLDRQGEDDAVFYECDNVAFEDLIESYDFYFAYDTFTDISIIAPTWGVAAVNLSVGYEREHSCTETLNMAWCHKTIDKVEKMLIECGNWPSYAYIPSAKKIRWNFQNIWSNNHCYYCGQPIKDNEGVVIDETLLCDSCYNEYKDYLIPVDESPQDG